MPKPIYYEHLFTLYLNANAFFDTFQILISDLQSASTGNNSLVPPIVNGMLAIELYLKFIYGVTECEENSGDEVVIEHIHYTWKLYKKINSKYRRKISEKFRDYGLEPRKFRNFAIKHDNDFVNWRYPQTHKMKSDFDIIEKCLNALQEFCMGITTDPNP